MKIAAGVILIIAAVFNIVAGAGYVLGGGAATVVGVAAERAGHTSADKHAAELSSHAASQAKKGGGMLLLLGLFLWVLVGLQITGAVFLFLSKHKTFIFIVAALSILGEIFGISLISFGWTNIFGLLGGILAFIGATSVGKGAVPSQA